MVFNIGNSRVIESREVSDGAAIRRRRETPDGKRFTTYERVEKPNLAVIKKNGDRELFDRVKLANSTRRSVGKFFSLTRKSIISLRQLKTLYTRWANRKLRQNRLAIKFWTN